MTANFGRIDMVALERFARISGITVLELHQALAARNLPGVLFCTASP